MSKNQYVQAGDTLGMVMYRCNHYELMEIRISSIEPGWRGGLIQTTMLTPYTVNEVAENTALMLQDHHLILTMRPFMLVPEVRERICQWIKWANEHPASVRSVLQNPVIHIEEDLP